MRSEGLGWKCELINDWGKGGVFMDEVYRSSKWFEVKDWGESVSELMIGGRVGVFMDEVYRSSKWWEVKDWDESVSELMIGVEGGSVYGWGL